MITTEYWHRPDGKIFEVTYRERHNVLNHRRCNDEGLPSGPLFDGAPVGWNGFSEKKVLEAAPSYDGPVVQQYRLRNDEVVAEFPLDEALIARINEYNTADPDDIHNWLLMGDKVTTTFCYYQLKGTKK